METTNNIKLNLNRIAKNGEQFSIKIRLNDECKNGHNDFSITGTIWEAGKPKTDKYSITSGAIGEKIAEKFPDLEIFNRLHLCDIKGAPMYADANGFYHLKTKEMEEAKFCNYYRATKKQFKILRTAEDQQHFKYLLYITGVVEQWQKEADEARELLEQMTGLKFVDDSVRYQLEPLTIDERKTMEERIKSGYYSESKKQERTDQKRKEQRDILEAKIKKEYKQATEKAEAEYKAKMIVLDSKIPLTNFIFYGHILTGSFNWKSYEKKVTQEEFNEFLEYAKDKTPAGVKWELK